MIDAESLSSDRDYHIRRRWGHRDRSRSHQSRMRRNRNLRRDRTSQPESDSERDRDPPIKNIASANTNANVLAASIPVKGGLEQQSSYDLSLPKIG